MLQSYVPPDDHWDLISNSSFIGGEAQRHSVHGGRDGNFELHHL